VFRASTGPLSSGSLTLRGPAHLVAHSARGGVLSHSLVRDRCPSGKAAVSPAEWRRLLPPRACSHADRASAPLGPPVAEYRIEEDRVAATCCAVNAVLRPAVAESMQTQFCSTTGI
jgi:hypothetical protein